MAYASRGISSLIKRDLETVWHPFTQMKTAGAPIPIVSAKGAYLFSEDGKAYLDGISSWWVNLHGHAHPSIAEKIAAQARLLEHVIFAGFTHPSAVALAERLLALLPGNMAKIFYSDNGSTAVEAALKMAIQFRHNKEASSHRKKILCFKNSYHGDTFGAMSASGKNSFNKPFWNYLFDVEAIDPPLPGNEMRSERQFRIALEKEDAACFIFEPLVLGSGGMRIYRKEPLDRLLELCKERNVITIADEVMTGFGRTGSLFACDQLSQKPDIICLSKGITGGFLPLGATACTAEIFNAFLGETLDQAFLHGHSYTANPLACTAALASLDLLESEVSAINRKHIAENHAAFCHRWQGHPALVRCESLGTLLALEYRTHDSSYFDGIRDRLYHTFLEQGILLRPLGNVLYILPPYCITEEELHRIYETIAYTLKMEWRI